MFEKRCLQAPYEGRGCQPLRSSPCEGFTAFAGSASSTLGLDLQAILLVTCRWLRASLR
uniref:Uncharacterized protein n=1 Tax=virus sp. ctDJ83 TaxID=2827625 RepID=A0A8S5RJV7_9VIRU|nr:MAG TPA: hypothetical protein [virus sp. ctDJ83]